MTNKEQAADVPRLRIEFQTAKNRGLHFALTKRGSGTFLIKGWMRRREKAVAKQILELYIQSEFGELLPYEEVDRT